MTARREQAALLGLLRRRKDWSSVTDKVEEAGSALAVLHGPDSTGAVPLFADDVEEDLAEIEAAITAWRSEGIRLTTVLDDDYPENLRLVFQRPPFLTWRGELAPERDRDAVAVVGTRKASAEGLRLAGEIATGLAEQGVTVVSGLAAGIDTAAHTAALAAGGRTVAVIGTGLRRTYPADNAALQATIGREGLLLSQFWPDAPPTKSTFPLRNAVMSGFAVATVVVEAAERSGARMQARLALEHGRHVFLLGSLLDHAWARAYAQRPGTTVVSSAADVLARLPGIVPQHGELVWS